MRRLKLPDRDPSKPKLSEQDLQLIDRTGIDGLKKQAERIVEEKLKEQPGNDGSQTPSGGNPVYKAMHACSAASRQDLSRAHRIPAGRDLTDKQVESVVNMLVRWIVREYNFYRQERNQQRSLGEFGRA